MTAICGFQRYSRRIDPGSRLIKMLSSSSIYANTREQIWTGPALAMGICEFRILPEDKLGPNPVLGGDGSLILVADIRLDNRTDLVAKLNIPECYTNEMSDSRILMKCIERWGVDAVEQLVGDFAFALWNERTQTLLLARDFMGQRPLHYHVGNDFFAFSSMPKGLHALVEIPYEPEVTVMADFLAHMPEADDRSFFKHISKVPPGHLLLVDSHGVRKRRYWNPDIKPLKLAKTEDYAEAIREQFDIAVAARLRGANGRVATQLSAGLDSSAVSATAARLLAPANGNVTAFTSVPRPGEYGLPGTIVDEGPLAAETAARYANMEHVLIQAGAESPIKSLDRNFFLYERPLLNLCNFTWIDAIRDEARARGLSVLLTGSMGNFTFSYSGLESLPDLLARGRMIDAARLAVGLIRNGSGPASVGLLALAPFLPRRAWAMLAALRGRKQALLDYSAVRASALNAMGVLDRAAARGFDPANQPRRDSIQTRLWVLNRVDFGNYNKGALGGWGIDNRDPTADRRLVELCLSIPAERFVEGGVTRSLARRSMSDRLPASVLSQTAKGYQAADWADGFDAAHGDIAAEVERIKRCPQAADIINVEELSTLLEDWGGRRTASLHAIQQYRTKTLRGISAGHFLRKSTGTN